MKKYGGSANGYYFQSQAANPYFPGRETGSPKILISKKTKKMPNLRQLTHTSSNYEYFPGSNPQPSESSNNASRSNNSSQKGKKLLMNRFQRNEGLYAQSSRTSKKASVNSSRQSNGYDLSMKSDLSREVNRLNSRIVAKEKQILDKQIRISDKLKDNEIVELYRVVHYYEGKMKNMESQLRKYQEALLKIGSSFDQKSDQQSKIKQMVKLYEEIRTQNEDINGKIEEKNYQIGLLIDKLRKYQIKLTFMVKFNSRKITETKNQDREQDEHSERNLNCSKAFSKRSLKSSASVNNRDSYGNIQSKINSIELNIKYLRKQNFKLIQQIETKDKKLSEFELKIKQYQKQNSELKNQSQRADKTRVQTNRESDQYSRANRKVIHQEQILRNQRRQNSFKKDENQSYSYKKDDPLNKVISLPNNMFGGKITENSSKKQQKFEKPNVPELNQEQKIEGCMTFKQEIGIAENIETQSSKLFKKLESKNKPKVFQKLRMQLMTQEISHQVAILKLIEEDVEPQIFEEDQYNLGSDEAQWLVQYICEAREQITKIVEKFGNENKQINQTQNDEQDGSQGVGNSEKIQELVQKFIRIVFPSYRDLTLKQQNNLKIHIYNSALNRAEQFDEFLEKSSSQNKQGYKQVVTFQEFKQYFKRQWGLLDTHIDVLSKAYYQMSKSLDKFNFSEAKKLIFSWGGH